MKLQDYDFQLPERLIASFPCKKRDESRLLVVDRKNNSYQETRFKEIVHFFNEGDCLVLNNTKVIPSRLYGISKRKNREHEVVLLNKIDTYNWKVIMNRFKQCKEGDTLSFKNDIEAVILQKLDGGFAHLRFNQELTNSVLWEIAELALPPYIRKQRAPVELDKETYQTVYSENEGSIASPTAGLHFTQDLLEQLKKKEF